MPIAHVSQLSRQMVLSDPICCREIILLHRTTNASSLIESMFGRPETAHLVQSLSVFENPSMSHHRVADLLKLFKNLEILVLGDCCLNLSALSLCLWRLSKSATMDKLSRVQVIEEALLPPSRIQIERFSWVISLLAPEAFVSPSLCKCPESHGTHFQECRKILFSQLWCSHCYCEVRERCQSCIPRCESCCSLFCSACTADLPIVFCEDCGKYGIVFFFLILL